MESTSTKLSLFIFDVAVDLCRVSLDDRSILPYIRTCVSKHLGFVYIAPRPSNPSLCANLCFSEHHRNNFMALLRYFFVCFIMFWVFVKKKKKKKQQQQQKKRSQRLSFV